MPYKSDKIKIAGTSYDRRVKLTDKEREEIKYLYKTSVHSQSTGHRTKRIKRYIE